MLNEKFKNINEALKEAPFGMLTVVLPKEKKTIKIAPENLIMTRKLVEGECLECENGIATFEELSTTVAYTVTNGADLNRELWAVLPDGYKQVWNSLFKAGMLQNSIVMLEGTMHANPLDIDPVEISESFTKEEE